MVDWSFLDFGIFELEIVRVVVVVAGLYAVQLVVNRFIGRIVDSVIEGHHYKSRHDELQREETLTNIFKTATAVVLWIIAVIFTLQEFGFNLAALLTSAGVIGIVIGFGAQSLIKDYLSGMFIITENQYRIGDVVKIAGQSGLVEQITIRMTKLRDIDGNVYFVPNGEITTVKNMTLEFSGAVIDISVSYDTDINEVEKIINEVGKELAVDPKWEERILEPITFLRLDSFGDSSVNLKALGKVMPLEQWNVVGEYRRRLKKAFEVHHIEIPFPQRVVHERKTK